MEHYKLIYNSTKNVFSIEESISDSHKRGFTWIVSGDYALCETMKSALNIIYPDGKIKKEYTLMRETAKYLKALEFRYFEMFNSANALIDNAIYAIQIIDKKRKGKRK